jgi:uncharacterized membrane protein YfcA
VNPEPWQWGVGAAGAILVGVSKTGVPGLGILTVALFALGFPARASVGLLLPLLIVGDVTAVAAYRRHAEWRHLLRLFPWTAAGVLAGWPVIGRIDNVQVSRLIGAILLGLVALQQARRRRVDAGEAGEDAEAAGGGPAYTAFMGILAGFTTMVANAAGPIMILYLLAMRLPKMAFVGTQAWYFLIINVFKVPFSIQAGLITQDALAILFRLTPLVLVGALAGRRLLRVLPQKMFETLALALTAAAAAWLLVGPR